MLALAWAPSRFLTAAAGEFALRANTEQQPAIAALTGGRLQLVADDDLSLSGQAMQLFDPLDLAPRPTGIGLPTGYVALDRTGFAFGPSQIPLVAPPHERVAIEHDGALFVPELCFDLRAWQVRASFARVDERWTESSKLPRIAAAPDFDSHHVTTLERPDGKGFSRQLEYVARAEERWGFLLTDSGDLTLWTVAYSGLEPRLEQLELPDGDPWTGWDRTAGNLEDLDWLLTGRGPRVRGQKRSYKWTGAGFDPVAPPKAADAESNYVVRILDDDVLTPRVEVAHSSGAPRLEHRYEASPRWTALALIASTLNAPAVTLAEFARRASAKRAAEDALSLVSAGRRPWLLALHVALGLTCAHWLARRRTFGLRRMWWALALVVGPAAAALAAVLEPVPRPPAQPPTHARAGLLIAGGGKPSLRRRARG